MIVSNKESGQKPGPSILKISKQNQPPTVKSKISAEISPSRQPLIGPELEYPPPFVSDVIPADVKSTAVKNSEPTKPVPVVGVPVPSTTPSSGRERTTFSTFGKTSHNVAKK